MKKKLIPLSVGVILSLAFVTGCGEGEELATRYNLTTDASADYKLVGVDANGYLAGEKVTFGVVSQSATKVIDEVTAGQLVLNDEGGNIYTFTMPESDVNINVTMENVTPVTPHTVTVAASEEYKVSGLEASYVAGDTVTFGVRAVNAAKEVSSVKMGETELTPIDDNLYSFVMPDADVTLTVTLADVPAVPKFNVTFERTTTFDVFGIDAAGYTEGSTVKFSVRAVDQDKVIDSVTAGTVAITHVGGELYSLVMPASNVTLSVTIKNAADDDVPSTILGKALAEARDGLTMDTVYEERQQYYNNDGTPSGSPSRYAKRVISEMSGDYNRVTRYNSQYDYSGNFDTPIDVSQTTPQNIYMFARNPENGYLATTYLGLNNELIYSDVLDTATDANLAWYKTFGNPFNYLTEDNFTVDPANENRFILDVNDVRLSDACTGIAQVIFGDIQLGYSIHDFAITLENGHLASYEGTFNIPDFEWYESTVLFSGKFTSLGAESLDIPTTMSGTEDAELQAALDALKKHNYTVEVNADGEVTRGYSDGGEHFLQDIFGEVADLATAAPIETYYYEQLSEFDDFTELYEYSVRQSVKIRNEFFTFSSDRDGVQIVPQMVAGFDISSAFFDKEGNTYTLKTEGLPYYFVADDSTAYSPFSSTTINTLKITLGENGDVTFETTDSWGGSETVKYTNVGTTTVAAQVVNTNTDKLTKWEDYLKTQAQADALNEVIPTEIVNILPTPKTSVDSVAPIANVTTAGVAAGKTTTEEGTLDEFEAEVPEDGETLPAYVGSWSNADYDAIELYDDGTGSYGGGWFGESFNYTVDGNVLTGVGEDFIITMTFDPTAKTLVYKYVQTTPNTAQIAMSLDSYGDNVDLQYDDLLVLFSDALGKAGFTYNLENLEEYEFIKTMTISEVECEVSISLGGYNDMFVVEYSMLPL